MNRETTREPPGIFARRAGWLCVVLVACTSDAARPAGERSDATRPQPQASAVAAATSSPTVWRDPPSTSQHPAAMPSSFRARMHEAVRANQRCVACHPVQADQWRGSHHQRANVHRVYREAFEREPLGFCRSCHAPEAEANKPPPKEVSELGVACVTCHVTEPGKVLAPPRKAGAEANPAADSAHVLLRSARFASDGGCAGCHEFRFPTAGRGRHDGAFMQTTVREHQRSRGASQSCASCHMPRVDGARSHAFTQVRDPKWLRENLRVTAAREADRPLTVTLSQPNPGHAFPTGDLFRRLEVGAELHDPAGAVVARQVVHLARHLPLGAGFKPRTLVRDDRVFDEPRVVELPGLEVSSKTALRGTIRWWVRYQRVATVGVGTDSATARVESEVKLHEGELLWRPH